MNHNNLVQDTERKQNSHTRCTAAPQNSTVYVCCCYCGLFGAEITAHNLDDYHSWPHCLRTKNMTSWLFTCCPPAFQWVSMTESVASAGPRRVYRLSFSSTLEPFRPLTFALVVYLVPVSSLLGSDRRRTDSATCSQERWCFFLCLGGVESISLEPSVTLNVRRETAHLWSSVTQVLNVARLCRWWM